MDTDGQQRIVRADTGAVVATVGSGYSPLTPAQDEQQAPDGVTAWVQTHPVVYVVVADGSVHTGDAGMLSKMFQAEHYGEDTDPETRVYATRAGQPGLHPVGGFVGRGETDEADYLYYTTTMRYDSDNAACGVIGWSVDGRS